MIIKGNTYLKGDFVHFYELLHLLSFSIFLYVF